MECKTGREGHSYKDYLNVLNQAPKIKRFRRSFFAPEEQDFLRSQASIYSIRIVNHGVSKEDDKFPERSRKERKLQKFTEYEVHFLYKGSRYRSWKRFSDFVSLDSMLRVMNPGVMSRVEPPNKHWVQTLFQRNLDPNFLRSRRCELNIYLKQVLSLMKPGEMNCQSSLLSRATKAFFLMTAPTQRGHLLTDVCSTMDVCTTRSPKCFPICHRPSRGSSITASTWSDIVRETRLESTGSISSAEPEEWESNPMDLMSPVVVRNNFGVQPIKIPPFPLQQFPSKYVKKE